MAGWLTSQGVAGVTPPTAPSCRLPPRPDSAREARRFVGSALADTSDEVVETAMLLTSELVTNAVLHAGTDLELRVWAAGGRVHVRVADAEASRRPVQRAHDPEGTTGRGLQLVEALAAAYGVDVSGAGKAVWFELWPGVAADAPAPSDWGLPDSEQGRRQTVRLVGFPAGLCRAAQRHRSAILREGRLALLLDPGSVAVGLADLLQTANLNDTLDVALDAALSGAGPDEPALSVELVLPVDCAPAAATLSRVLDALNAAARAGRLLTRPVLPEVRRFRQWLLSEVAGQLGGAAATPWAGGEEADPDPAAPGSVDWDDTDISATDVPTVAADDDNRIVALNRAAAELLGWEPAEIVGQRITTLIPPAWRERHVAGFTSFLLTGESRIIGTSVRVPALRRDGGIHTVDLAISVRQTRQGRTVFVAELRPV